MKVLCFGDNTSKDAWADKLTRIFAQKHSHIFRGKYDKNVKTVEHGCYHTSTYELSIKKILESKKYFDQFVILDQPIEKYSHSTLAQEMYNLTKILKDKKIDFVMLDKTIFDDIDYWVNLLKKNKSFCLRPWITHVSFNGYRYSCERGQIPLVKNDEKIDWQNNQAFQNIRNNMLKGIRNEKNCDTCIQHEKLGSYNTLRWHDTLQWATKLKLKSVKDLEKIKAPVYYEIRPGNKCNVMCRTCTPGYSHLIEKEYKTIDNPYFHNHVEKQRRSDDTFDVIDFDHVKRVYVTGGEPTINKQFYKFLSDCIASNRTNFELRVNSNFMNISNPLRKLFSHFTNLGFTSSIDGIPRVQNYIRWKTDQKKVEKNIFMMKNDGHSMACISTISIYNITTIGDTCNYLEKTFPFMPVQLNLGVYREDILSSFNHPNRDMALQSIERAMNSKVYYDNERDTRTLLQSLYNHYSKDYEIDKIKLKKFFIYNDILDKKRGSSLASNIPELEACRKYINI